MNKVLIERELDALEFAAVAHKSQKRKAPAKVPYVSHCFAVGLILSRLGYSEDVIIAGFLHDVVEDTRFTIDDISKKFGETVAAYVLGVTEQDKSRPWRERKAAYREYLKLQSPEVKAISAADLLANHLGLLNCLRLGQQHVLSRFKVPLGKMLENNKLWIEIVRGAIPTDLLEQIQSIEVELSTYLPNNSNTT